MSVKLALCFCDLASHMVLSTVVNQSVTKRRMSSLPGRPQLGHLCALLAATGHTAAWVLFAVSQHPEVEAGILKELRALNLLATPQNPIPQPIQWDDVPKLVYLTATIKVSAS